MNEEEFFRYPLMIRDENGVLYTDWDKVDWSKYEKIGDEWYLKPLK
jgi:hypothetical protein